MISIHDLAGVDRLRRDHKLDPGALRKLRNGFYKRGVSSAAALDELPTPLRQAWAGQLEFHALTLHSRHDSARDGASKLIFRTARGLLIESVILRLTTGRTALCVSTQVGCAANCAFCATGKMGIAQNLSPAEILDQVLQANRLLIDEGRRVRNLVFMGMGEPFHNEEQFYAAIDVLLSAACFHFNPKRLLVSTVGIPDAMLRCARRYPDLRMALSLHSAQEEVRRRIMPIAARHSLADLKTALAEVAAIGGHEVMIEYLLLKEINDSPRDAELLADYLRDIPVHINLIPYNPIAESLDLQPSPRERQQAFSASLKAAGYPVTTRYSLGADIAAACGQLVRQEHRVKRLKPDPLHPS